MKLTVNNQEHTVECEPDTPLLWVLRDVLNYTGTKYGCGISYCGACSVLIEGKATKTCNLPISSLEGMAITTIEGISTEGKLSEIQKAWVTHQVPQCGYCQSGMIIATESLLKKNASPSEEEINQAIGNICRCGTYPRIKKAIQEVIANTNSLNE